MISQKNKILKQQIDTLYGMTITGSLANVFAAWLVFSMVLDTPIERHGLYLSIAITIISFLRLTAIYNHKATDSIDNSFKTVLVIYSFLTFSLGLAWGGMAYIQSLQSDLLISNMIYLINFGLIAGGLAILSVWAPAYILYVSPQIVAIFTVLALQSNGAEIYFSIAFLAFITIMITGSLRFHRAFVCSLQLKQDLMESQRDLENKVKTRTKDLIETNKNLQNVLLEKEEAEQSLQYLAYHDELTGLPNRNLLIDRVNQAIKSSARDDKKMAILFLDLDRFKSINDSLGHNIGDKLLKEVPARLDKILRSHDTVSRNGGDEFVVVLEKIKNTNEAVLVAKKIIKCLTETFNIQSHTIHIGASIGISIYPTDGDTPLILLRNADTAMYRAKQSGGKQLQFYDESMSQQLKDRLELESELHNALGNNEFYMVYQPQVDCTNGKTTGFESLLRWKNEKCGEVFPDRFIPILEETGLIYDVGKWVVSEVLTFASAYSMHEVNFSINLSALQCDSIDFVSFVNDKINQLGINPGRIEFEITESLLIKDFYKTKIFLDELHSIGCTIALDDFGTGYTSMNYLTQLPIDIIKIDRSFVKDIDSRVNLQSIVKAILTMSRSLNMDNVFEGVETKLELAEINKMDGKIIQGYLYSKPLKSEEVFIWLSEDDIVRQAY